MKYYESEDRNGRRRKGVSTILYRDRALSCRHPSLGKTAVHHRVRGAIIFVARELHFRIRSSFDDFSARSSLFPLSCSILLATRRDILVAAIESSRREMRWHYFLFFFFFMVAMMRDFASPWDSPGKVDSAYSRRPVSFRSLFACSIRISCENLEPPPFPLP